MPRSKRVWMHVMRIIWTSVVAIALLSILCEFARGEESDKTIVLIGGPKSHSVGEHDFANGIELFKEFLNASPDTRGVKVAAYPDDWPAEASAFDGAITLVLYFDGVESHPLLNAARRAVFEQVMGRGVGVVALHQASTAPAGDTILDLPRWLGGARYGMFDRTEELVSFQPAAHPIGNGVKDFLLHDEFYPTIRFPPEREKVSPILTGKLHPQFRDGKPLIIDKPESHPVAWTFERADGGRSFTFTGLHYLVSLDNPALRKLLLNAVFWTAKMDVPQEGVRTNAPADAAERLITQEAHTAIGGSPAKTIRDAIVSRRQDNRVTKYPWGHLTWFVSRELRNSDTMTVGEAVIKPGQSNPRHYHPNCDEVLHVIRGHILQSITDKTVEMNAGDTISIPAGVRHSAKNIGTGDAVLAISYSSADRQVIGE